MFHKFIKVKRDILHFNICLRITVTQGQKNSTNRNVKRLIVRCSPTTVVLFSLSNNQVNDLLIANDL